MVWFEDHCICTVSIVGFIAVPRERRMRASCNGSRMPLRQRHFILGLPLPWTSGALRLMSLLCMFNYVGHESARWRSSCCPVFPFGILSFPGPFLCLNGRGLPNARFCIVFNYGIICAYVLCAVGPLWGTVSHVKRLWRVLERCRTHQPTHGLVLARYFVFLCLHEVDSGSTSFAYHAPLNVAICATT